MTIFEFTVLVWGTSVLAGFLGALTGLGGGVIIVPVLALLFGVDMRYAIGASLVSVIATSAGAAAAFIQEGYTNIRVAMLLEIATTVGAVVGAWSASIVSTSTIGVVFGCVLLFSAFASQHGHGEGTAVGPRDGLASRLRLNGALPASEGGRRYFVQRLPAGFVLMGLAGALSGLLGIGSGAVKVLALDQAMRLPFKVSTTTSNFMIGVTAAASAGVYLGRGYLDPGLAMPVVLGVLPGSLLGARVLPGAETRVLRLVFAVVIVGLAFEMIYNGWTNRL